MNGYIKTIALHKSAWTENEVVKLCNSAYKEGVESERSVRKKAFSFSDYSGNVILCDSYAKPEKMRGRLSSEKCLIGLIEDNNIIWKIGVLNYPIEEEPYWAAIGSTDKVEPYVYMVLPEIKII